MPVGDVDDGADHAAATAVAEQEGSALVQGVVQLAVGHLEQHFLAGLASPAYEGLIGLLKGLPICQGKEVQLQHGLVQHVLTPHAEGLFVGGVEGGEDGVRPFDEHRVGQCVQQLPLKGQLLFEVQLAALDVDVQRRLKFAKAFDQQVNLVALVIRAPLYGQRHRELLGPQQLHALRKLPQRLLQFTVQHAAHQPQDQKSQQTIGQQCRTQAVGQLAVQGCWIGVHLQLTDSHLGPPRLRQLEGPGSARSLEPGRAQHIGLARDRVQTHLHDLRAAQQPLELLVHHLGLDVPHAARQHGRVGITNLHQRALELGLRVDPSQHCLQRGRHQRKHRGPEKDAAVQA